MVMLQKVAGAALEEKLTEFKSPQSIMKDMPAKPATKSKIPPELERQVIAAFKEKHFRTSPDIALPALGGRTPRQAAADPKNDVSKLKAELGVSY